MKTPFAIYFQIKDRSPRYRIVILETAAILEVNMPDSLGERSWQPPPGVIKIGVTNDRVMIAALSAAIIHIDTLVDNLDIGVIEV